MAGGGRRLADIDIVVVWNAWGERISDHEEHATLELSTLTKFKGYAVISSGGSYIVSPRA